MLGRAERSLVGWALGSTRAAPVAEGFVERHEPRPRVVRPLDVVHPTDRAAPPQPCRAAMTRAGVRAAMHAACYSDRSAVVGSTRVARRAGM
jgi:hypothetical protein